MRLDNPFLLSRSAMPSSRAVYGVISTTHNNKKPIRVANVLNPIIEKKYVSRPLEDQIPFLDRDVFLNEMIINPIDQ